MNCIVLGFVIGELVLMDWWGRALIDLINRPFTPSCSAKSKSDKFSKITNWVKLKNKQHPSKVLQLSNE